MHLLVREIALAAVGVASASAVQVYTPLTEPVKRTFMGAIFVATALVMARVGGLL
jgi:hypothetical protein